jgi:hypothetical protein
MTHSEACQRRLAVSGHCSCIQREQAIYPSIDESVEASFEETFEQNLRDYWTLVLPPRPYPKLGCMHERYSATATLTCGCFYRERDAHIWAHENLYAPYSVKFLELPSEPGDETAQSYVFVAHPGDWPTERDPFATLRESPDDECSFHANGGEGPCGYCEDSES